MRRVIGDLTGLGRGGQHPDLLLRRYLYRDIQPNDDVERQARRDLLATAIEASKDPALHRIYGAAFRRWDDSFPEGPSPNGRFRWTQHKDLQTRGRLIVGLGGASVLEVGLTMHHTYGVPFIPGSALKGLASHYCDQVWGQRQNPSAIGGNLSFRRDAPDPENAYHRFLFGTTEEAGAIIFHDAWLLPESLNGALCPDVMTPHHPEWQLNKVAPTDFDNPTPIPFLSVAGTFRIRISWNGPPGDPQKQAWTSLALQLLQEALSKWGVGGKTSSGYGRLGDEAVSPRETASKPIEAKGPSPRLPESGTPVEAILLEEKTKAGGWKAKHIQSGLVGPIINNADVPDDKVPDEPITLRLHSDNPRAISFRYPTAADEQKRKAASPQGNHGNQRSPSGKRR